MRPNFMIVITLGLFAATLPQSYAAAKPNFIFLLVDDIGWGDLGCYGSTFHETPNLDKLRTEGMKFTQAYSACTVCSPSRAAILTGKYPGRLHLTDWITGHKRRNPKLLIPNWKTYLDHEQVTLPEALQEAGYKTRFLGKWHLMPIGKDNFEEHYPEAHGFDDNIAGREWGQPKGPGKYFHPWDMPNLEGGEKGSYLTDRLTDYAVEFIDQAKDGPFLCYLSYYAVHNPLMARPEYVEKYQAKAEGFDNSRGERVTPAYAGMLHSIDDSLGRIMARLKKHGLEKNTVIIFTGDNGGTAPSSSGGLRGAKGLAYEGATREPLLIKWPGRVKPGSVCDTPVIGTDFYPTMLAMAGLPARPTAHQDGKNLVPLLRQNGRIDRDSLFWHYPHYHKTTPYGAIRKRDLKLIEFFEDNRLELYDLQADPAESNDLAATRPEKLKELHGQLKTWRESVQAQMPTANPNYARAAAP